jgi:hypothetical protein
MKNLLLSRDAKNILNRSPETLFRGELYRALWGHSTLSAPAKKLLALREQAASLFKDAPIYSILPKIPKAPRYFFKGSAEKRSPRPIPYLLDESTEVSQAEPLGAGSPLIRSLCKGSGTLRQTKEGFVYLEIDRRFAMSLMPYLKAQGLSLPPYFSSEGTHTPVIPAREMGFHYLEKINEVGQEFSFEVDGLYSMKPASWPEVEQVWFFKLSCPSLEALRRRYFLTSKPNGHAFHMAVAIEPRRTLLPKQSPALMRINSAILAA